MSALTSTQRKYLRSLGHHLKPLVLIGKQGVTDEVIRATAEVLEAHELMKVRFNDQKEQKKELVEVLTRETQSELAGMIGHVAILYREHPEPEKRRIKLPA